MKIVLVCRRFPPQRCGVGDYTFFLAKALADEKHGVTVYSEGLNSPSVDDGLTLIQYTPQLFPGLAQILAIFRRARGIRSIQFHELYYPPSWSLRGLFIGVPHWIRFILLVHLADLSFFSTAEFREHWARRLPYLAKRMAVSPVGSNIPVVAPLESSAAEITLLHFGGAHPTHLYDFVLYAFERAVAVYPDRPIRLVLVGVEQHEIESKGIGSSTNSSRIEYRGYLESAEVSLEFRRADLVLAPFLDGVTTRRGSVMGALAHAKPIVTTFAGRNEVGIPPWREFLDGVSIDSVDARDRYAEKVIEWVGKSREEREELGKAGEAYFKTHFSWGSIARAIVARVTAFSR